MAIQLFHNAFRIIASMHLNQKQLILAIQINIGNAIRNKNLLVQDHLI